jgi:hypothetical protein
LYQPSKYAEHNTSLDRWMLKFNAAKPLDITAKAYEIEQFIHDGIIDLWGVTIRFDWTKRHQWQGQIFPFQTVGQFERKFAYHIKLLHEAGLISRNKEGKYACSAKGAKLLEFFRNLE